MRVQVLPIPKTADPQLFELRVYETEVGVGGWQTFTLTKEEVEALPGQVMEEVRKRHEKEGG